MAWVGAAPDPCGTSRCGRDPAGALVQRTAHLAGRGVAVARVQRERDRHRVGQLRADRRDHRVELRRVLVLLLERQLGQRGRLVGQATGDQLVGDDPQRVEVRTRAGVLAAGLLGGEVGGRAEHRSDLGDARLLGGLRDPEVGELDLAFAGTQQVAGLDVTVDDPVTVGVVEPLAGLFDDRKRRRRPRPSPASRRISAQEAPSMYSITMKYWPVRSSVPES